MTALPASSVLLLITVSHSMEYPFGQFGSAVLFAFLPSTPNLLTGKAVQEVEKFLTQCKRCSITSKILVCYQRCFPPKSNTMLLGVVQSQPKLGENICFLFPTICVMLRSYTSPYILTDHHNLSFPSVYTHRYH